jgi:hypothetical protein
MFKHYSRYINGIVTFLFFNGVRNILLLFFGSLLIWGCNIVNPKEQIPTYLKIDSVKFTDGSHDITSAWVYYNNAPVGVFRLPATVPVLADKAGTIAIGPGITFDGIQDQQSLYPFYAFDTFAIDPAPGQVLTHIPVSKYTAVTHFPWKENFESGSDFQPYDSAISNNAMSVVTDPNMVFEGYGAGYIHVTTADTVCEVVSNKGVSITQGDSYLEFDYKSTNSFIIGLVAVDPFGGKTLGYQVGLRTRDNWTKMYVGLQTFTSQYSGYVFYVVIRSTLDPGSQDGYVLLDNMKIVSY